MGRAEEALWQCLSQTPREPGAPPPRLTTWPRRPLGAVQERSDGQISGGGVEGGGEGDIRASIASDIADPARRPWRNVTECPLRFPAVLPCVRHSRSCRHRLPALPNSAGPTLSEEQADPPTVWMEAVQKKGEGDVGVGVPRLNASHPLPFSL